MRILSFLAVLFCGCGPITFKTTLSGEGVVQGSPLGALLDTFPAVSSFANIDFSQNQDFQNNRTTRDMVRSVKVKSLVARVQAPSSMSLGFVESLELRARAAGLDDVLFAQKAGVPQAASPPPRASVALDLPDVDLAPWVRKPTTSLLLSGRGRQPSQDNTLEVVVELEVGASPF